MAARRAASSTRAPTGTNALFASIWSGLRDLPQENQFAVWTAIQDKMKGKIDTLKGATRGGARKNAGGTKAAGRKRSASTATPRRSTRRNQATASTPNKAGDGLHAEA